MTIPQEIRGQKYISLATFRRNGTAVHTPVWFGEEDDKLHVVTRRESGKYKRLRNSPRVRIALCTMMGTITGPVYEGTARILPPEDWQRARRNIASKYWLARIPSPGRRKNVYLEIAVLPGTA